MKGRNVPAIIESAITRNPTGNAITFFFHHRTKILMVNSVHWNYRGGDNYEKWRHENSKSVLKTPQFLLAITLFSWQTCIQSQGFSSSLWKRSSSIEGWLSHDKISWIFPWNRKTKGGLVVTLLKSSDKRNCKRKAWGNSGFEGFEPRPKDNSRVPLSTELPLVGKKSTFTRFFVPET